MNADTWFTRFKEAQARIRRTSTPFQYQLVIQRAFEEGEEQLLDDAEDADEARDEKVFLLDESLHLRSTVRDGLAVFAWRDLSGDPGDLYEYICDGSVQPNAVSLFELIAIQCQFERRYRRSHVTATEKELHQFSFSEPIPAASASTPPETPETPQASPIRTRSKGKKPVRVEEDMPDVPPTVAPPAAKAPEAGEVLTQEYAELHLFDVSTGAFILQDPEVTATVWEIGKWECERLPPRPRFLAFMKLVPYLRVNG